MSLILPLVTLSLSVAAVPLPGWAPHSALDVDAGIPALGLAARLVSVTSSVSSTPVADSLSLGETRLDTRLSSTLNGLASVDSAPNLDSCTWISSNDLANYFGTDVLNLAVLATGLVVQAGEDAEAWVSIPEIKANPQAVADPESCWVTLSDLVSDLNADAWVPLQSILVTQPDGSSDAVVYVSLEDHDSTLNALSLDHTLDSFLYTDIAGVSSDLSLGDTLDPTTPPAGNPHLDVSTQVGSQVDSPVPEDDCGIDASIETDSSSNLLTPTSLSLTLDNLTNDLNSRVGVGIASQPEPSSPGGASVCACVGSGN